MEGRKEGCNGWMDGWMEMVQHKPTGLLLLDRPLKDSFCMFWRGKQTKKEEKGDTVPKVGQVVHLRVHEPKDEEEEDKLDLPGALFKAFVLFLIVKSALFIHKTFFQSPTITS